MGLFSKVTEKVTDSAVETAKESLNDKIDSYSGIIKVGLTIAVLAFGSKKITQDSPAPIIQQPSQQPIIINNYYGRPDERRYDDGCRHKGNRKGRV